MDKIKYIDKLTELENQIRPLLELKDTILRLKKQCKQLLYLHTCFSICPTRGVQNDCKRLIIHERKM